MKNPAARLAGTLSMTLLLTLLLLAAVLAGPRSALKPVRTTAIDLDEPPTSMPTEH
jgi:hypothetical protein